MCLSKNFTETALTTEVALKPNEINLRTTDGCGILVSFEENKMLSALVSAAT